ncbi:antibiotic biosynthesis monooxygenase family protein [Elongatibacter sediminis]|uniref:Antibiotic biosynthesis monooxygenase n=1 Tax=Elongatibacter sediminis TaxID=3119006 RepID=A0AAW9RPB5_9GAMM
MNTESNFQSIWTYEIDGRYRTEFLVAYGSTGSWVELFRQCAGYIGTELKQDTANPDRFLTIDRWQSQSTFAAMKQTIGDAYRELDARCEAYTLSEHHVGFFADC